MVLSTMYTPSGVAAAAVVTRAAELVEPAVVTANAELVEPAVVTGAAELVEPAVVTGAAALVFSGLDAVIGDPTPDAGAPLPADLPHAPTTSSKPTTSKATDLSVTSLTPCVGFALPKPPAPNSPNMRCCGERVIAMTNTFSNRDPKAPPHGGPRAKRPSAAEWTGSANTGKLRSHGTSMAATQSPHNTHPGSTERALKGTIRALRHHSSLVVRPRSLLR